MNNLFTSKQFFLFLLALTLIVISSACENSAGNDDDHISHADPFGLALIMNGVEIAKQENGEVTYNEGNHLELTEGEESGLVTVRWIDEHGDRFLPPEGQGYSLNWQIDDEDILEIVQHESDGLWAFHFSGKEAGETSLVFQLWHIDHEDFTSHSFHVHVESAASATK